MDIDEVSFVEFRKNLSSFVGKARYADEWTAVTQHGTLVGGFVSMEALKLLIELYEERDRKAYDKGMKNVKKHGTISHQEMKKRLGLDV